MLARDMICLFPFIVHELSELIINWNKRWRKKSQSYQRQTKIVVIRVQVEKAPLRSETHKGTQERLGKDLII